MYNPKSLKAEEFIDHQEILDSLAYADAHKDDIPLIDKILEKARLRKGLSHREASVLLACEQEEKLQEIYDLAQQIKKEFLRKPYCNVCPAVSFQLLCEWLHLLSLPCH